MQWRRRVEVGSVPQEVKIDLLGGPLGPFRPNLLVRRPRVRPKGDVRLHAHCIEEALEIDRAPIGIPIEGQRTEGEPYSGTVFVPQVFPYLLMKLCAFRDRKSDARKDVGRHHALDLYTIVGLMTEPEYEATVASGRSHAEDPHVQDARRIVAEDFSSTTAIGLLRLREHPLVEGGSESEGSTTRERPTANSRGELTPVSPRFPSESLCLRRRP